MKKRSSGKRLHMVLLGCLASFWLTACRGKNAGNSSGGAEGNAANRYGSQDNLDPVGGSDGSLVDRFLRLLQEISARAPELNQQKDKRGKLRLLLGANLGAGCMEDVIVKTVEVTVNGEKMGDLDVSTQFSDQAPSPPEATGEVIFEISFGDMGWTDVLAFTNDETKNTLFGVGSRKAFTANRDNFSIGKIERIRIRKAQAAFHTIDLCQGATFVTSCRDKRKITELDRYHLTSLQIKVNGEVIYDKGNVDHLFSTYRGQQEKSRSVGLVWVDENAAINESYVKMKQREDCTALQ